MAVEVVNFGRLTPLGLPFNQGFVRRDADGSVVFALNLEAATAFFKEVTIKKSNVILNDMGLYTLLPVGRNGEVRTMELGVPKHLLQGRKDCVTWAPKGKAVLRPDKIELYPYEYMGEQCVDSFFDTCMEKIFPNGNDIWDFTGTPEGQALFAQLIDNIFLSLGNSFTDLVWDANSDQIDAANSSTEGWWRTGGTTAKEWEDFYGQQTDKDLVGFNQIIENYKADGRENFNVAIASGDVDNGVYQGDVIELFNASDRAARPEFRQIMNRRSGQFRAVRLVSPSIYDAYYDYLTTTYNGIPAGYQLLVNGESIPGVLYYKNIPVISMDEWLEMDNMLGINTYRVVNTVLGNFGVAHDMNSPQAQQYNGLGFVAQQRADLRNKGMYDMYTTFKLGADILNPNLMTNASLTITPDDI